MVDRPLSTVPAPKVWTGVDSKLRYRSDIDGLRALAVVPVVLFHAGVPGFSGGFVGVDIFFVISGYLITSLITEEMRAGRFSIALFYERRARRILPALFAVLIVTSLLAFILLLPGPFQQFESSLVATLLFGSNIVFWRQTGYFDGGVIDKPLLHTWSLSLEEQYYVIFPLLLFGLRRLLKVRWEWPVTILAFVSFALNIWLTWRAPTAAFYMAPPRAWELLLGALLALNTVPTPASRPLADSLGFLGLGAIAWGIFGLGPESQFPGLNVLFPCVGAALVIHSGTAAPTIVNRVLGTRALVFIGLISYSLYLWHWPLLVFARKWNYGALPPVWALAAVALSVLLAMASWRFIELPIRRSRRLTIPTSWMVATALIMTAALGAFGAYGRLTHGWRDRLPAEREAIWGPQSDPRSVECFPTEGGPLPVSQSCQYGADVKPIYALWGDSHAGALIYSVGKVAAAHHQSILFFGDYACPPLLGINRSASADSDCARRNDKVFEAIAGSSNISVVILVARFAFYFEGPTKDLGPAERLQGTRLLFDQEAPVEGDSKSGEEAFARLITKTVEKLLSAGKRVVLVYPIPEVGYDVPATLEVMSLKGLDPAAFTRPISNYEHRQRVVFKALDALGPSGRIMRIHPESMLCHEDRCITELNGKALYMDDDHLSLAGADYIAPLFEPVFNPALAVTAPAVAGASSGP